MYFIEPEPDRLHAFLASYPADKTVVMLNLLRFRERADYQAGDEAGPCSGFEAFVRYGEGVTPLIKAAGADQVWQGRQAGMLIGPQDKDWHLVALVRYPSAQAFVEMVQSAAYGTVVFHRTAALEDSRLIAMEEL